MIAAALAVLLASQPSPNLPPALHDPADDFPAAPTDAPPSPPAPALAARVAPPPAAETAGRDQAAEAEADAAADAAKPAPAAAAPAGTPTTAGHEGPLAPEDLKPFFASGPAADAKAAYDAGRYEDAVQKLARVSGPEAAYLRALALSALERHQAAVAALEGLEARLPDVADRVLYLRGQELAAAGRKAEAVTAWAAVPDSSLFSDDARVGQARLRMAAGDRDGALAALAPLLGDGAPADPSRPDAGATALLLTGQLRAAGPKADPDAARSAYLACWSDHPVAPEAQECLAGLKALPGKAGAAPGPEASLRRAERLIDRGRSASALALLEPLAREARVADASAAFACRVRGALGRAYRRERQYAKAIDALRPVVETCQDPDLRARSLYVMAGASSIAGDRDEAIGLYRRLAAEFPRHALADDALVYAADLLVRANREPEAREALAEIVRSHSDGDYRWEARFKLAWMARRAGQADVAVAQLLAMEEAARGQDPYEEARAAYWRARLLSGNGEDGAKAARGIWRDLATRFATDYYGLLSRLRLAELGEQLPLPALPEAAAARAWEPGPLWDDPHFRAGLALARMGLTRAASTELISISPARLRARDEAVSGASPRAGEDGLEPVLVVADLLDRCGDHQAAHNLLRARARSALRQPPTAENLRTWRIAYPAAYRDAIARYAPPAGVPVDLLQGLMREESALDPRVISPAGAVGLTQLMLPTAQSVATRYRMRRPSQGDLMKPEVNIQIGARYLGELIRHYDGQVPLALAAYNAGAGAVGRWLEARGHLQLDEFVEEIPFEETRGYVKRVLRSYAAYRLLYGGAQREGGRDGAAGLFHTAG